MVKITVENNLDKETMMRLAKKYGKSAVQEAAERIYQESQSNCPVKTGALKKSGYITETDDGWEVGYNSNYAEYVDRMPQSWLTRTGHGGKERFFSSAVEHYSGGALNVK